MIKDIVKDMDILSKKSEPYDSNKDDRQLLYDMADTINAHITECVGLSAVQIGVHKRVIIAEINGRFTFLINPIIVKASPQRYTAEERCLSLDGVRKAVRHNSISVVYRDLDGEKRYGKFTGKEAQIIQHEIDHLNGLCWI